MTNSKSVLLPKTDYTSHYNDPAKLDAETLSKTHNLLDLRKYNEEGRVPFVLHDGPPYANGYVHMGHAVNKVLKDFVSRSQFMQGKASLFRPGWDCHGLPIEWKVQEHYAERGLRVKDVPVLEFRQACREYALGWQEKQANGMKSLGVMADWENPYLTLQPKAYQGTLSCLYELVKKGLVYSSERPVLWSVAEETALADAEVEYQNSRFQSLMVRFPVVSYNKENFSTSQLLDGASVVCWTSTPWSLPGNRMVAVNKDMNYCVLQVEEVAEDSYLHVGERVLVADTCDCLEQFLTRSKVTGYSCLEFFLGEVLEDVVLENPFKKHVPVKTASFVRDDSGTGFVHIAPSLGPDDFYLAREHHVEVDKTLNADGTYHSSVPLFAGQHVLHANGSWGEAQGNVLNYLKENNLVVALWNDKHSTAYSWRSKAPLLYRATKQWFVRVKDGLSEQADKALNDVNFYPEDGENRLRSMLDNRPDWCVSRQRSWGVPMALFVNKDGDVLVDEDVMQKTLKLFGEHGGDCWYSLDKSTFLGEKYNPDDYEKLMDVLDVWFESGATWSWVLGETKQADLYLEGSDQHRGWFQSSLLESVAMTGVAPYKNLFTHGFVLDAKRKKMSKSDGNVVDPYDVLNKYGADALRYWVMTSDVNKDVSYSDKYMQSVMVSVKKFRNTLKWLLGVTSEGYNADLQYSELQEQDKWVLAKLYDLNTQVKTHVNQFNFSEVAVLLRDFCNTELSALWMNMRKDSFYCDALNSPERESAVFTASRLFEGLVALLSPFVPFMTEQSWEYYGLKTVDYATLLSWSLPEEWRNQGLLDRWDNALQVRDKALVEMEKLQKSGELKATLEMSVNLGDVYDLTDFDFAGLLNVSVADYYVGESEVHVHKAEGHKCVRCWRVLNEVPEGGLCVRCDSV